MLSLDYGCVDMFTELQTSHQDISNSFMFHASQALAHIQTKKLIFFFLVGLWDCAFESVPVFFNITL